jgi:hypothetical protein
VYRSIYLARGYNSAKDKAQTSLQRVVLHARSPCKATDLAAASAASLSGRTVWPGTQQNATDFPALWRWNIDSEPQWRSCGQVQSHGDSAGNWGVFAENIAFLGFTPDEQKSSVHGIEFGRCCVSPMSDELENTSRTDNFPKWNLRVCREWYAAEEY